MQPPSLSGVLMGIVALAGSTSAVSLASFIPRIDRLSAQCSIIYNAQIDGCTAEDFKPRATCSAACVQGLVRIQDGVKRGCAGDDPGETSIIGVFQAGLGIGALCPGVTVVISSSSSVARPTGTKPPVPPEMNTSTTSTDSEPTSTEGITTDPNATNTNVGPPRPTSQGPPPPPPPPPAAAPTGGNQEPQAPQAPNSQLSNADSGGGSPFDVVATGSASSHSLHITLASLLATALLFVSCA